MTPYHRPNTRATNGQYPGLKARGSLVARGFLDADYRITPAGDAYAGRIVAGLRVGRLGRGGRA